MRHTAALAVGILVGLAAVLVHRSGALPLLLAVVASVATALWLRSGTHRSVCTAFCVGWVALLGVVVTGRPEGDWAVGGDLPGYALAATGLLLVVLGVTALPRRRASGRT